MCMSIGMPTRPQNGRSRGAQTGCTRFDSAAVQLRLTMPLSTCAVLVLPLATEDRRLSDSVIVRRCWSTIVVFCDCRHEIWMSEHQSFDIFIK